MAQNEQAVKKEFRQFERHDRADRPTLLPDYYNGNDNFDTWVSHFECVSDINGWTEEEKLLWVRVSLKGRAHVAYNCFAHETRETYLAVKEALQERFEPSCKAEWYKLEFERHQKKAGDSWADLGDDLTLLARKAFPALGNKAQDHIALSK